jgi:hypothetical protein
MSLETISCPSCAWESEIEKALLGRTLKCPKCKESFVAEAGGNYDLVEPPAPPRVKEVPVMEAPTGKPSKKAKPAPAKAKPEERKVDPDLLSSFEKWAEE